MIRPTLGVCVITHNEEENIAKCLSSIPDTDQVVVVDSGSSDATVEIAKKHNANVIYRKWTGYSDQKQFALDQMTTDWIIPIDGDEWLSKEAYKEIIEVISNNPKYNGYKLTGRNLFMGRLLSVGKGLDHSIRLVKNKTCHYDKREIHETLIVDGELGNLEGYLIHNSSNTISLRMKKMITHTEAEMKYVPKSKLGFKDIFIDPVRYFLGYFFKYRTWRDGIPGIIWLALFSFQNFLRNAKYYEHQISEEI